MLTAGWIAGSIIDRLVAVPIVGRLAVSIPGVTIPRITVPLITVSSVPVWSRTSRQAGR